MTLSALALVDLTQAKSYIRMDTASSLRVDAEYVGAGDGETKVFTLDYTPIEGSLRLYVNGVLQVETDDYTISGVTVTFVAAPTLNHPITASYDRVAVDNTLERLIEAATKKAEDYTGRAFVQGEITESHHGNGSKVLRLYKQPVVSITSVSYKRIVRNTGDGETVAFSLGYTPKSGSLTVYKDGVLQTVDEDYTLSGQIVTFVSAPADGAELIFRFEVSMDLSSGYFEQIHIGRLTGSWLSDYEYVVVYKAGHAATRALAQVSVPDAMMAVLIAIANWYDNRLGLSSANISGVGSASYSGLGLPDASKELLSSLRTELC
jgi:hypothetical protein